MIKMNIKRFWQILMTVTICCAATACGGDDNDEPETPGNTNKDLNYAKVDYSIELPQDVVDLWDVEVKYTGANGQTSTEKMDRTTWSSSVVWDTKSTPIESIPTKVTMSVTGKPKAPAVELDPDKVYKLGKKYNLSIRMLYNNGETGNDGASSSSSLSASGNKLAEAVKKDNEILPAITVDIPHVFSK